MPHLTACTSHKNMELCKCGGSPISDPGSLPQSRGRLEQQIGMKFDTRETADMAETAIISTSAVRARAPTHAVMKGSMVQKD